MGKLDPVERRWSEVETLVRRMCQLAQESGPVVAREHVDRLMPKLKTVIVSIVEDERYEAFKQYEM